MNGQLILSTLIGALIGVVATLFISRYYLRRIVAGMLQPQSVPVHQTPRKGRTRKSFMTQSVILKATFAVAVVLLGVFSLAHTSATLADEPSENDAPTAPQAGDGYMVVFRPGQGPSPASNVYNDGTNLGIGTTQPSVALEVNGPIASSNGGFVSSLSGTHFGYNTYWDGGWKNLLDSETGMFLRADQSSLDLYSSTSGLTPTVTEKGGWRDYGNTFFHLGQVGIGTTNPQAALDVNGIILMSTATLPMGITTEVGGTTPLLNFGINFREPNYDTAYRGAGFRIDTREPEFLFSWLTRSAGDTQDYLRMVLTEAGNLGIGALYPTERLHVGGNIIATGTICDVNGCIDSGSGGVWNINGSNIYYNNGNVGIGTSDPKQLLHIRSASDDAKIMFTNGDGDNAVINYDEGSDALEFRVNVSDDGSSGDRRIYIYNNGDVCIGDC